MGSGASASACEVPGGDLHLPASGLRFSAAQLSALNGYVESLCEDDQKGRMSKEEESGLEMLVQRMVDGAGQRDPRFKCCHLVALHRGKKMRSRSLEYLVTLDSFPLLNGDSEECQLEEGPLGYARIRLTGREADKWEEFLTPSGYLCRDKLCSAWVGLLARVSGVRGGGASRALSATARARAEPYQYCYLERVCGSTGGEVGASRVALVQGAAGVVVRAGRREAKLVVGVRTRGPPPRPPAPPLTHPLAALHYSAINLGFECVSVPPGAAGGGARGAWWRVWQSAVLHALDAHLAPDAPAARLAAALNALIDNMRDGHYQGSLVSVSRHLCWCVYRRRLDRCAELPSATARPLPAQHLSHHLLLTLDELLSVCGAGGAGVGVGYCGAGVSREHLARRGVRGEWPADAACIRELILRIHNIASTSEVPPPSPSARLECALWSRWGAAVRPGGYCRRQLRYLARLTDLLRNTHTPTESPSPFRLNLLQATSGPLQVERAVQWLAVLLDQARDQYLHALQRSTWGEGGRDIQVYRSKKWNKLKDYYDASSACLIDAVRRDPALRSADLSDPADMMKSVLHWLQKGAKDDKKYLGPVLKPFLDKLFTSSMENSWFVDDLDEVDPELEGLRDYCLRVHEGTVDPCSGLLDAAHTYVWAKVLVDFVDRYKHIEFRLVFPSECGSALSFPVRGPTTRSGVLLPRARREHAKLRLARRAVVTAFHNALLPRGESKQSLPRQESEEILTSVKNGNYWRNNSKPDIISTTVQELDRPRVRRRSRRARPATSHGFPSISISSECDQKTLRRKYHTLRSLVYTGDVESARHRPKSAGSSIRRAETFSRPTILETMDFINSVRDSLCVYESGLSDAEEGWCSVEEGALSGVSPLNVVADRPGVLHLAHRDLVPTMLDAGQFTALQELCALLPEGREGALYALHRAARAARARSADRAPGWQLPSSGASKECYRPRAPDRGSEDERPSPPPPPPRTASRDKIMVLPRYPDYLPPSRVQEPPFQETRPPIYTGIINPIYDIKIPRDRFQVKRSRSLGRSFSTKSLGLDLKYNLTLGHRSGKRTNDVITAIEDTTGETGIEGKNNFFQKQTSSVVGDSYRISRFTID